MRIRSNLVLGGLRQPRPADGAGERADLPSSHAIGKLAQDGACRPHRRQWQQASGLPGTLCREGGCCLGQLTQTVARAMPSPDPSPSGSH
jgi:hypothetical protein